MDRDPTGAARCSGSLLPAAILLGRRGFKEKEPLAAEGGQKESGRRGRQLGLSPSAGA